MGDEESDGFLGFKEIKSSLFWRALVAEFVGTFVTIFIGTATIEIVGDIDDVARIIRVAFGFGLTIASMLKAIVHVSGGHLNPAITVGFLVSGDIKLIRGFIYIIIHFIASLAASGMLMAIAPESGFGSLGATRLQSRIKPINGMIMEIMLTFILVLLIQGLFDPGRYYEIKGSSSLAIGFAVVAAHMAGVTWTGCSINPARTLGPAFITNTYKDIWIYFAGPFIGAILAGLVYRHILREPERE